MNCKPGDLAIIVVATNPANVGRIVECISLAANGDIRESAAGPARVRVKLGEPVWFVRCASLLASHNKTRKGHSVRYFDHEGWILDSRLRPISGVLVTDDVADEVTA
ncbi:hypothetical protein [Burkholderia stabilis]|uniref:Uncharacterized protein n=1 Tax=Burkholderia stabilis TaxID=95485 RepID=A0AAJ5T2S7_9BURK|nr:hypothetical protein [Burkholderia stabilis]VBB10649.1 hypothetical protein BSTAB16_0756 [Burkholderia stabilis]VBB13390.1 hypothetical protein BSTAB16_3575 [Burkholderia stabilis]